MLAGADFEGLVYFVWCRDSGLLESHHLLFAIEERLDGWKTGYGISRFPAPDSSIDTLLQGICYSLSQERGRSYRATVFRGLQGR